MSKIQLEITKEELEDIIEAVEKQRYYSYLTWFVDEADNKFTLKAKRLVKLIEKLNEL